MTLPTFWQRSEEEKRHELLSRMSPDEAEDVAELLQYQHDDAGGLMTTDYVAVPHDMTAGLALSSSSESWKTCPT